MEIEVFRMESEFELNRWIAQVRTLEDENGGMQREFMGKYEAQKDEYQTHMNEKNKIYQELRDELAANAADADKITTLTYDLHAA